MVFSTNNIVLTVQKCHISAQNIDASGVTFQIKSKNMSNTHDASVVYLRVYISEDVVSGSGEKRGL